MNINDNPESSLSQAKKILAYLRKGHRITSAKAFLKFGVTCLFRRISDIEGIIGYPPLRERIQVRNRDEKLVWVKEYFLKPEDVEHSFLTGVLSFIGRIWK